MTDFDTGIARRWAQIAREDERLATQEAAKALLALLPEPTLDEVGLDWDTHHMTGAITPYEDEVVMLWYDGDANVVICSDHVWRPDELTPTGNRYKFVKVKDQPEQAEQTDHPAALKTAQDFREAPKGTIVGRAPHSTWQKNEIALWSSEDGLLSSHDMSLTGPWQVLRWGWTL